jgi:transporter family-2 protein
VIAGAGRRAAGLALALTGGLALAGQSRINGELADRVHDGVAAALVSFGSGFVLLVAAAVALPVGRRGVAALRAGLGGRTLRWWECAGGISGAYFVTTQGLSVGAIGLAVFTVALVAGQVGSSLLVDRVGLGPGGPRPVSAARVVAAALAVVAVVVAVADRLGSPGTLGLAALPAVAGIAVAWQQAMNGRVQVKAGALAATLVNFGVGTASLLVVYPVVAAVRGLPDRWPAESWLYLGGPLGIAFVLATVAVVRVTGVLVLGLGLIAGQVLGSLALDLIAPAHDAGLAVNTVIGAGLTLAAVVVAAAPTRPPARSDPPGQPGRAGPAASAGRRNVVPRR